MGEAQGFRPFPVNFETICIHHAAAAEITKNIHKGKRSFIPPLVTSNLYKTDTNSQQYLQGRVLNPTRSILEKLLALLNNAKFALVFSSGMGAIGAVLGLLKCGDHVVCTDDVYGGTNQLLTQVMSKFGIKTTFADFYDHNCVKNAITPDTKLIWTENPTNPLFKVIDLCKIQEIAHEKDILLATDNSFLTPYLQRPLDMGADIVIQALAKYLNGHSDVVMGVVATSREDLYDRLKYVQTHFGHVPSPFDCYQAIRGLKTLPLRLKRHHTNSLKVVEFLNTHPKIECIIHPGHCSHPKYKLFQAQASGHSGVFAFYIKGTERESTKFMTSLKIFRIAVSLGGYESLLQPPYFMSHHMVSEEQKKTLGITPNLVRMCIGLEEPYDLIADIEQALCKI